MFRDKILDSSISYGPLQSSLEMKASLLRPHRTAVLLFSSERSIKTSTRTLSLNPVVTSLHMLSVCSKDSQNTDVADPQ